MLTALAFPDPGDAISKQGLLSAADAERPLITSPSDTTSVKDTSPAAADRELVSPFELANSIRNVRRTSGDISLKDTWQKLGIEAGSFAECSNDCEARISRYELSPDTGAEVVLKLTRSLDFCRYLIFGKSQDRRGWKFLGYVDHDFNRYEMARHRIATVNSKRFFVVRGQEGSGSGFALYSETWYQVSDDGLKAVLSYSSDGQTNPWPAGLARSFKVTALPDARRRDGLILQYTVNYTADGYNNDHLKLEFINQHRASFNWDGRKFVFDPQASNISESEIDAIANVESDDESRGGTKIGETTFYSTAQAKSFIGGGYEVFLKHNLPRLLTIAKEHSSKATTWLRQFLTECRDTNDKKLLLAALAK